MTRTSAASLAPKPYSPSWDESAEIRVFKAPAEEWSKVTGWRNDLGRHGWKLLQLTSDDHEIVAVFGKTRPPRLAHG
ncbi:MAG: hypothetical protein ABI765_07730 [Gemmatimonadota bacterium]